MPLRNPSEIVSFDADAALAAAEDVVEGTLYSLVEFDAGAYNALYVDDATLSLYEDEEEMFEHFERIHSYTTVDFAEIDLFVNELFPEADRVHYIATKLDYITFLRVYAGREGVAIVLDPDEPVTPIADAVEGHVGESGE